jgi:hypothetical protein
VNHAEKASPATHFDTMVRETFMSNEEMNKKMEFIVEQQAQFAADIEVMREIHKADTELLKEETKLIKQETKLMKE